MEVQQVLEQLRQLERRLLNKYDMEPVQEPGALEVLDALDDFILDTCKKAGIPPIDPPYTGE